MDELRAKVGGLFHHHPAEPRPEDGKVYCCDEVGWVEQDQAFEHRGETYREGNVFADTGDLFKEVPRA